MGIKRAQRAQLLQGKVPQGTVLPRPLHGDERAVEALTGVPQQLVLVQQLEFAAAQVLSAVA
eukprot:3376741-Rhodomonas_salina.1